MNIRIALQSAWPRRFRAVLPAIAVAGAWSLACGTVPESDASHEADAQDGVDSGSDAHGTHDSSPTADSGAPDSGLTDVGTTGPEPLIGCEVAEAWANDAIAQWMEPSIFEAGPNGGLVWAGHYDQWSGSLTRSFDGEILAVSDSRPGVSLDAAWQRRAVLGGDSSIEVRTTVTDELIATLAPPTEDWNRGWLEVDLSDNGMLAAAAGCDGDAFRLGVWEVGPAPRLIAEHSFGVAEPCRVYHSRPQVRIVGDVVYVAGGSIPRLSRWAYRSGELLEAADWPTVEDPMAWEWNPTVLSFDVSPDGRRVVAVGVDGVLRVLDAATLRTRAELAVATNMLNENTYAPWITTSPVAFSPRGTLIAALGGDPIDPESAELPHRFLLLLDADTLEVVREVSLGRAEPEDSWGTRNAVASFAFARDGRAIYVQSMWGISAYSCAGVPPRSAPTAGTLDVRIEGPDSVRVGETTTFTATHLGNVGVHAHRFVVDGERVGFGGFERTHEMRFDTPGEHRVRVEIEDGAGVGSAELTVVAW